MQSNFIRLCKIDSQFYTENQERRKASRKKVHISVGVTGMSDDDYTAELFDFCEHGCKISDERASLSLGKFIRIRLANNIDISGVVRWKRQSHAGVEFTRQASMDVVNAVLAQG